MTQNKIPRYFLFIGTSWRSLLHAMDPLFGREAALKNIYQFNPRSPLIKRCFICCSELHPARAFEFLIFLRSSRFSLRYQATPKSDDELCLAMIRLAKRHGRYGYRKVTVLLRMEGWLLNHKQIERLLGGEGLHLPIDIRSDVGFITKAALSAS